MCGNFFNKLVDQTTVAIEEIKNSNYSKAIEAIKVIDTVSSENLLYHDTLMNLYSVKENLLNSKIIKKESSTTIKSERDFLVMDTKSMNSMFDEKEIENIVDEINQLKRNSEKIGADFLYIAVPEKSYYEITPENVNNYSRINFDQFAKYLELYQIPNVNMASEFSAKNISDSSLFFVTDAHWKPSSGFIAYKSICQTLSQKYGYIFDDKMMNIDNYNVITYPKWFLGNLGKRVGLYFTWYGADDFDLIVPNFQTSFEESVPFENVIRKGSFEKTLIYSEKIKNKDFYNTDPYTCYCGGNHRLQIIKNKFNYSGKKIMLIKDSFAFVVAPYLSLQVSELHMADTRDETVSIYDKKVNWIEYMEETCPDIVLVLYKGIPDKNMLDFRGEIK